MATFLFIMIVLALLALVVTLVVFTPLPTEEGPTAKSARQLPRPLPGHNRIPYRFQPHYPPLKATAFSGGGNALFYNILIQ